MSRYCYSCFYILDAGKVQPQQFYSHTHNIRQITHESRKEDPPDTKTMALKLYKVGVRAHTAELLLDDADELARYGATKDDIARAGLLFTPWSFR